MRPFPFRQWPEIWLIAAVIPGLLLAFSWILGFSPLGDRLTELGYYSLFQMVCLAGWGLAKWHGQRQDVIRKLLFSALEGLPTSRFVVDRRGQVIYANPATGPLLFGAKKTSFTFEDILAANPGMEAQVRLVRKQGQGQFDYCRLREGASEQWLKISLVRFGTENTVEYWQAEDITLALHNTLSADQQQMKLIGFINQAPVGFFSTDAAGRIDFLNTTMAHWLGAEADTIIRASKPATAYLAPLPDLRDADHDQYHVGDEAQLVRIDGKPGARVRIVFGSSGEHSETPGPKSAVVHDLTEELAWRRALQQVESHFTHLFQSAPIGIVVIDHGNRIAEANSSFVRLLRDKSVGDIVGTDFPMLVDTEDRIEVLGHFDKIRKGGNNGQIDIKLKEPNDRNVQIYASRIVSDVSADGDLLLHVVDATDRKNLEAQFAQGQKMQAVGQLAGGIAHDFNNLLTAMIGFCDLLLLRHQPGDQSFADIMQIKQNANRAASLVRQLLAFSRQQTLRPKVLDITDVLADLSNLLRRLLGEAIELRMTHGRDLGLVKVDQGQFEQVIINLAVNARDSMGQSGTLFIRTSNLSFEHATAHGREILPAGDYVAIEVTDTGKGIPLEIIEKIFEPFFTTKEIGAGTGLGLSTVYGIVKQTGGFVFAESRPGSGATFRIILPRHHAENVSAGAIPDDTSAKGDVKDLTGQGTILLVEDEDAVRIFAARALRNKGYTVMEAGSGDLALTLAGQHAGVIDIMISDVVMPNMDGPTLAQEIRKTRPDIKIIFISGYAEDALRRNIGEALGTEFLPKPFSLQQLASKVKEVSASHNP